MLQRVAARRHAPRHVAVCCSVLLQCVIVVCCSVACSQSHAAAPLILWHGGHVRLQCVAVRCWSVCCSALLQRVAVAHSLSLMLQHHTGCVRASCNAQGVSDCSVMQCVVAVCCCSVLQRGALSAERVKLQCDAVRCCSVLQCVEAWRALSRASESVCAIIH